MMMSNEMGAAVADAKAVAWEEHPRIAGILMKTLLTSADHPLASVALVRVPVGGQVTPHQHEQEIETVYVLAGESKLVLGDREVAFEVGQVVAIPRGLEHALVNVGSEPVDLVTFFTPALV